MGAKRIIQDAIYLWCSTELQNNSGYFSVTDYSFPVINIETALGDYNNVEAGGEFVSYGQALSPPFIFQYQNAPSNTGLYGVINIASIASIAQDEAKYNYNSSYDNIDESVGGVRKVLSTIGTYRSGAFDALAQLKASLRRQSNIDLLWNNGLSFVESSDIRDVTEVFAAKWEERYQMDVIFYTNSQYDSNIVPIAHVPIQGYIEDELKINITVE